MPGCFTPTEIVTAWEAGADMVKLFPAELGGPALLRALSAPLPQVSFVPVGGVSSNNTAEYIRNGAAAVGVGNSLVSQKLLEEGRIEELSDRAAAFVREVERGRHPS